VPVKDAQRMMARRYVTTISAILLMLGSARTGVGQSNSLFLAPGSAGSAVRSQPAEPWPAAKVPITYGMLGQDNRPLQAASFTAVQLPPPRVFRLHDLITVIIREEKKYKSDSDLEQEKDFELKAKINKWPRIHNWELHPQTFTDGKPEIDVSVGGSLEGSGKAERKDQLITRITAEIIDIKPNGNLVLQGRKFIKTDEEEQEVVLTGTCRSRDVGPDNTILSTQVHDLKIIVEHKGAVRDATRRGWIPRLLDFLRPF